MKNILFCCLALFLFSGCYSRTYEINGEQVSRKQYEARRQVMEELWNQQVEGF